MARRISATLLLSLALGACAHGGEKLDRVAITDVARQDPWEKTNRQIFSVSMKIDRYALSPVTNVYRTVVPDAPRRAVSNGYNLLQEPTHMVNAVAQGKVKSAFRAADRILVNGVLGLGVADHASDMGLTEQEHDFGQTLAVWGVPSGPFVMLPFLGPSTARDAVGFFVDFLIDPVEQFEGRIISNEEQFAALGIRILDIRSGLRDQGEQLLAGAADPYATTRSAWLQLRRYQIFDGNLPDADDELDIPPPPGGPDSGADDAPAASDAQPSTSEAGPLPSAPPAADAATAPSTREVTDPDPAPQPE
jgi:phospholipid-binding lipoprotein MlaA